MKKKLLCFLCLTLVLSILPVTSIAQAPIAVIVNGEAVDFDVQPIIDKGRTLVPVRGVFEKLGADVTWDGINSVVRIQTDYKEIVLFIGYKEANVNEIDTSDYVNVSLDVAPKIIDGRTMVPLRFIAEAIGATVNWNAVNRHVTISYENPNLRIVEGKKIINIDDLSLARRRYNIIPTRHIMFSDVEFNYVDIYYFIKLIDATTREDFTDIPDDVIFEKTVYFYGYIEDSDTKFEARVPKLITEKKIYISKDKPFYYNKLSMPTTVSGKVVGGTISLTDNHEDGSPFWHKASGVRSNIFTQFATTSYDKEKWMNFIIELDDNHELRRKLLQERLSEKFRIAEHSNIIEYKEYLFFNTDQSIEGNRTRLYRTNLDGSKPVDLVGEEYAGLIGIRDGWVYYSSTDNFFSICKIRIDGTEKTSVINDHVTYTKMTTDTLYYVNRTLEDSLFKLDLKSGQIIRLVEDENSRYFDVDSDGIYYAYERGMYKIKHDGSETIKLLNEESIIYKVANGLIFFRTSGPRIGDLKQASDIYVMTTNGTRKMLYNDYMTKAFNLDYFIIR